jgi:hypothetical protein
MIKQPEELLISPNRVSLCVRSNLYISIARLTAEIAYNSNSLAIPAGYTQQFTVISN